MGATQITEPTSATVGDRDIDAVSVAVDYSISGSLTETWSEKVWFAPDHWLPLRIERNLDLRGLATFTEQSTFELTDTSPTR